MTRSLAATRERLLATGLRMLHERGLFVAVTHVRLSEVARAADLTTGAAYRVWGCQDDFHRDLAVAAVRHREEESIHETVQLIHAAVDGGAPLREVLRLGAVAHLHQGRGATDPFLINLSLRTLGGSVPELAEAARVRHAESMANFERLYDAMLGRYRRRMRPPLGIEALSASLAALTEGFAVQALNQIPHPTYQLPNPPDGVAGEWTLLGLAIEGIVERLTEPVPEPRPDASEP